MICKSIDDFFCKETSFFIQFKYFAKKKIFRKILSLFSKIHPKTLFLYPKLTEDIEHEIRHFNFYSAVF